MVGAIPEVVVLDDVLDAYELLFRRRYLFQEGVVITVYLIAAAGDLVVVVAVLRDQGGDNLVGDQVFPVCAGDWRAIAEHDLGRAEVLAGLVEQVLDLCRVSSAVQTSSR